MNRFEKAAKDIVDSCEVTIGPVIMRSPEGWDNTNYLRTTPALLMTDLVQSLREIAEQSWNGCVWWNKHPPNGRPADCADFEEWASSGMLHPKDSLKVGRERSTSEPYNPLPFHGVTFLNGTLSYICRRCGQRVERPLAAGEPLTVGDISFCEKCR